MRKNGTVMRSMTQGVECWQIMMFVLRQTIGGRYSPPDEVSSPDPHTFSESEP